MSLPTLKRILTLYSTPSLTLSGFCLNCASCSLDCCRLIDTLPPGVKAIHFGSYATVVEPVAGTQRALIEREHKRSLISYDPNIRLNVEPDLGRWHALLDWMLPRTHLLKVSDEDLGLLFPGVAPATLAAQWLARGVAMVVVTRGGEGAIAWTAAAQAEAAPVKVDVVDTVGAGDTFQAALLTWLAEQALLEPAALGALSRAQLEAAVAFAVQAAAITCSRRGADLPRRIFPAGWALDNLDNRTPAGAVNYVNAAWIVREILESNPRPGEQLQYDRGSRPKVAWKTGTSYGFRDAWAVGGTRRL